MSRDNVELIRRGYEAFAEGGIEAVLAASAGLVSPDIEWIPPKDALTAGTYRGRVEAVAEFHEWAGQFENYEWEPREFIDAGDRVLVVGHQRGRGRESGVEVTAKEFHLWTLRDGRIARMEMFRDWSEALEAAGLSRQDVEP